MTDEEDEAFAEIEQKQSRKLCVQADLNPYETIVRNNTLEEVAEHLEHKFTFPFGKDTIHSFATYIRGMKK